MRKVQLMISALLLVSLLMACAPQAAPAPAPQAPAGAAAPAKPAPAPAAALPAAPAKLAWQVEWEKTLAAARIEGRLSFSTGGGFAIRNAMADGFKAAYGMPVEALSGAAGDLVGKISAERRAGLYLHDVFLGGSEQPIMILKPAGGLDPILPVLLLPDLTEPELVKKTWYEGQLYWLDKDRTVVSLALNVSPPIAININLVKEGELKSWQDLLHPRWQEKLVLHDPRIAGSGGNFLMLVEERLGWDYFAELVKTKPIVLTDTRLMIDWLARGKVAIVVAPKPEMLAEFVTVGAPVRRLIPEEGTWMSGGSSNLAVLNKRPHPNATKVFVNWLLSKEGSTALSKAGSLHSTRLDVPTDHLPPDQLRDPKMKYVVTLSEEIVLKKNELRDKAKELLERLMGK